MSDATQTLEKPADTATDTKAAAVKSGNLIHDTAVEIAGLSKAKALKEAHKLAENIEASYFRLGGVLAKIKENTWWEGSESFGAFVAEHFGFAQRKAEYLIEIYTSLVDKQIPWEKVSSLGWSKLKDLAKVLTLENVDDWVAKAQNLTVLELQAALKAKAEGGDGSATSVSTSSDQVTVKFKLKTDQVETVNAALAKAKAELNTEYDSVALEGICAGFLAGTVSTQQHAAPVDLETIVKGYGDNWMAVLETVSNVFPQIDINVTPVEDAEQVGDGQG